MHLVHTVLENAHVRLEPLSEAHREPLRAAAMADPHTWDWWPRDVLGDGWDKTFDWQLEEQGAGRWLLHAVLGALTPSSSLAGPDADEGVSAPFLGQSCYLAIRPEHDGVEIGGTWYAPAARGTAVNPASKLLLIGHAFACGAERVELKTHAQNARSRAAMEKMGAIFEGVHRRHMKRADGSWRDTAWYSVIRDEWPAVKAGLEARLAP
jgi:RimJ/RimL family protein N-acetyltransferase